MSLKSLYKPSKKSPLHIQNSCGILRTGKLFRLSDSSCSLCLQINPVWLPNPAVAIQELLRQWLSQQPTNIRKSTDFSPEATRQRQRNYNVRQLLSEALAILESMDQRQADVLRLRFLEGFTVLETAHKLARMAEQTVDQLESIDRLAAILQNMEKRHNINTRNASINV